MQQAKCSNQNTVNLCIIFRQRLQTVLAFLLVQGRAGSSHQHGGDHLLEPVRLVSRRASRRRPLPTPTLTSRECEILRWVANGKSAWEIGEILEIAKRTVDAHVQASVRKLGAANRTHAVALALRDSIIKL